MEEKDVGDKENKENLNFLVHYITSEGAEIARNMRLLSEKLLHLNNKIYELMDFINKKEINGDKK
jgi:hypothetical protein